MKKMKKLLSMLLAVIMVLAMAAPSFAAEGSQPDTKGKITIVGGDAIDGQTYTIYKIFDLVSYSYDGEERPEEDTEAAKTATYAYKIAPGWETFIKVNKKDLFTFDSNNGDYITDAHIDDVAQFAKDALDYANDSNNNISNSGSKPATAEGVEFTGLDLGYYLVDSSAGAVCSLDTTDNEVVIEEKNEEPTIEKTASIENNDDAEGTAFIGQTINYQIKIVAQAGADENYTAYDKMDNGLTFNGTVKAYKTSTTDEANVIDARNYVFTNEAGSEVVNGKTIDYTFKVAFTKEYCKTLQDDDEIYIVYSATLNENAVVDGENTNTATLAYGNKSTVTGENNTTVTKTYDVDVFKHDSNNRGLAGAIFELKYDASDAESIYVKKVGDTNEYKVVKVDGQHAVNTPVEGAVQEIRTPDDGNFTITGLAKGTYYLVEKEAPTGYNKLAAPIQFTIDADGKYTEGNGTAVDLRETSVLNNTGTVLPSTGGIGTTIFYAVGIILMAGAVFFVVRRKRA